MNKYTPTNEIAIDAEASPRYADLTHREAKQGGRVIGGDHGDLWFNGYKIRDGHTVLIDPEIHTTHELDEDEANDLALDILQAAFNSIGVEAVEHS